jgi:benzoyl-CoA reductase/2-hydroxyglutaryl-CoA dehydratase subunit BcrC/BadD/HgdB
VNDSPRVGYFYSYFPKEILYAFGRVPVCIFPSARDGAEAEPYLHKNLCALVKVMLASFLDRSTSSGQASAPPNLEGVVFSDICDAQRRLYDVWRAYVNVPVLAFLDLPRRADALGQEFYAATLAQFIAQLETRWGTSLTVEALADSIRIYNRQRALWGTLRAAWVEGRVPTATYYALRDVRFTRDPVTANAQIKRALHPHSSPPPLAGEGSPRLLLMGSLQVQRGLIDAIAVSRAHIIAEDSACDEREASEPIRAEGTREELLRDLAIKYLDAPAPRFRDLSRRLNYLARLAEARHVNGVICSYYKFCDLFLAEFPVVKTFFEAQKIPVLLLEDEGSGALSGQARTRLEAFVEMLR